jgi:hypothetical protein
LRCPSRDATTPGPVFRPVLKGSRVLDEPLSGHSAAAIVKRYAKGRFPPRADANIAERAALRAGAGI